MFGLYKNLLPLTPLVDDGTPGHRNPQRLANTGATESQTKRALTKGHLHLLLVGAAGVRVRFSSNASFGAGAVVNTRDVVYGPWSTIPFVPDADSTYVYAEAADGAAAYECFVVCLQG